jgi:uncharacterized surface protein with fasciclin (FAS1) repeats
MNMKRFLSFMKYTLLVAVVFSMTSIISSCDDDDDDNGPTVFDGSIMDLIRDDQFKQSAGASADVALDSLVKYLDKNPDLVALLDGSTEYTLFAPSNTAFVNLLATPGFPANIEDINPAVIKGVLAYHIVSGTKLKADLTPTGSGTGISTLYSHTNSCTGAQTVQVIKINDNGTVLTGSTNAAIEFQDTDNRASNGVVHVTKTVLIPPSVGASLTPILGKLSGTVLLAADFSILAKVITKADCGIVDIETTPISSILSATGPYTVFLPPNAVFEGTAAALDITVDQLIAAYSAAQWRTVLLNHIVSGTKNKADLTNNLNMETLLTNGVLTVTDVAVSASTPEGKLLATSGTDTEFTGTTNAPIMVANIPASNGVAHVVGKILFPN